MNDTTRWIMIILLLLLIAAAVFMLLRSPGKDKDTADRTDELAGGRDADRDGVPDSQEDRIEPAGATPGRGVYDQEADARDGGTLPAAERMDEYAHPDAVGDRRPEGTGGATRVEPTPGVVDDTAEPYRPEAGAAGDPSPERAPVRSDGAAADVQPLTDADISDGGREEPLTRADQEEDGSEQPVGDSSTYRAPEGRAVVVGDDRTVDDDGPAPADTGTGAPPTADEVLDGRTDAPGTGMTGTGMTGTGMTGTGVTGTGAAEATEDHHTYAPVFTEAAYGPGSAEPLEDGTGPAGWDIKANIGSMLFHTPESPSYDAVRAEVWFESEDAARAAGFAHWDRRRR